MIVNPETGEPITKPTLRKHFRNELDTGAVVANAMVVESMHQQAVGRAKVVHVLEDGSEETRQERVTPVPAMGIWWTKARMRWSEHKTISGPDGGPIEFEEKTDARERVARNVHRLVAVFEAAQDDGSPSGDGS